MEIDTFISVIIPVYNSEEHLTQCLDSIFNQSLKEIEVICIDDCSTDGSLEIMKDYSQKDERFKFYQLSKNSGAGVARNMGLNQAKGAYISFIDSDDFIIDETGYEKLYHFGIEHDADIISSNMKEFTKDNTLQSSIHCTEISGKTRKLSEEYGLPWYFWKNLFKRKFLMENNIDFPQYRKGEDPVFMAKAITKTKFIYFLPIDFYAYRYRYENNPYKTNDHKSEKDYIKHFRDVLEIFGNYNYHKINLTYEKYMYQFLIDQKYVFSSNSLEKNLEIIFADKPEFIKIFELECDLWEKNKHLKELKLSFSEENNLLKLSLSNERIVKEKIQLSKSWKLTKPMRKCANIIRKLKI